MDNELGKWDRWEEFVDRLHELVDCTEEERNQESMDGSHKRGPIRRLDDYGMTIDKRHPPQPLPPFSFARSMSMSM